MREKLPKILSVLVLALILVNIGYFDYKFFFDKKAKTESFGSAQDFQSTSSAQDKTEQDGSGECSAYCQQLIDEKVNEAVAKIPTQKPEKTTTLVVPTSGPATQAKTVYIPLATEGTTVNTTWTDINPSEFYFDLADYPGAKEVRFATFLQALHGSAKVYARVYDQTNKRGVDYSDLETQSDDYSRLESSGITIWRGNNKYTVQLKSINGTQVLLKEAKLKIIF